MMDRPRLVGVDGDANVVEWGGRTWRVPQSLGPLDVDNDEHRSRPGVEEVVGGAKLDAAPATSNSPALTCHFLDLDQFRAAEDARIALARSREKDQAWLAANNATYGWASLSEVTAPCAMWFADWLFDPADPEDAGMRAAALAAIAGGTFAGEHHLLSRFYWQQWSDRRPPISVLCPNGREWCVDASASNGEGWTVTGDPPRITASPSIQVPGYHGHLVDGAFTPG